MLIEPGGVEEEYGVPIPGRILPQEQWSKTALKRLSPGHIDWSALFGRSAPVVLDLGCGNGRFTLHSSLFRPEMDHLGADLLPTVIRYATRRANQRGLHNVRFVVKDAQTLLREHVSDGSISEVHVYHPQPYHESTRAHLRMLTGPFLADVHRVLAPSGLFVVQTDNPDYWAYLINVLPTFFNFTIRSGPWPDTPDGRSRREILARSRGLKILRGEGLRRNELRQSEVVELAAGLPLPTFRSRGPWCDLDARGG